MTLPRVTREPVMVQTFDIAGEKAAQPAALRFLGQANLERSLGEMVKIDSRHARPGTKIENCV
jgi:hypothetical protein